MNKSGFLREYERQCQVLLASNSNVDQECMEKRDQLILLAKAAVRLRVVTNEEVMQLVEDLDDALLLGSVYVLGGTHDSASFGAAG